MKIKDYQIAEGHSGTALAKEVKLLLDQGFEPYGKLRIAYDLDKHAVLLQACVLPGGLEANPAPLSDKTRAALAGDAA